MKLVTVAEMQAIEEEANKKGVSFAMMMERAGKGVADYIQSYFGSTQNQIVTALVGSGNNGGDALVALEILAKSGWKVQAFLAKDREDPLIKRVKDIGGSTILFSDKGATKRLTEWLMDSQVVIDGLLGTGFVLPMRDPYKSILDIVKESKGKFKIVSIDCPSGINCDSGETSDESLFADLTVCLQAVKIGLLSFPAYQYLGQLEIVDLELPENLDAELKVKREVATAECVRKLLPKRPLQAHKGTFGTAMIIAGSINYTGAAYLSGMAAYRIGAGLVKMAVPGPIYSSLAGNFSEATWLLLPHDMGVIQAESAALIQKNLDKVTALLLGPGWGLEDTTKEFLERLLIGKSSNQRKRSGIGFVMMDKDDEFETTSLLPSIVIDADGLKLISKITNWEKILPENSILTPHPGEMAVMTDLNLKDIQANRMMVALEYSQKWGHIVVLKGALTIVAAPDGRLTIIPVAHPALARAGSGDVLAGIITGLVAQGIKPFEAATAGVWIHAQAGIEASERIGHPASVIAGDLLGSIAGVLARLG
jgi:NAD(P)H-hydrate epimerase